MVSKVQIQKLDSLHFLVPSWIDRIWNILPIHNTGCFCSPVKRNLIQTGAFIALNFLSLWCRSRLYTIYP